MAHSNRIGRGYRAKRAGTPIHRLCVEGKSDISTEKRPSMLPT